MSLLGMTPQWCRYRAQRTRPYVLDLERELVENGSADTRAVAVRLSAGLDVATLLVLLDALSAAVDKLTRDLAPASVDLSCTPSCARLALREADWFKDEWTTVEIRRC